MKKVQSHHKPAAPPVEEFKTPDVESTPKSKWIPVAFLVVLAGIFVFLKFTSGNVPDLNTMKTKVLPDIVKKAVNNPSTKVEITSVKETSGMIEFELTVNGQKYTSYTSRDGKYLFTSGIKVADLNKSPDAGAAQTKTAPKDIAKADKPNVTAFVVSNCPYGLQMQRAFKKAISEAPDLASALSVKYIGAVENGKITSMHGDEEAQENLRQICIREEQTEKYWPYVSCYMQEGKNEECLSSTGVDTEKLNSCVSDTNRGLKYAQADFKVANQFGVSGSPTLIANNKQTVSEFDFGGRNPNAIKNVVCAASKNQAGYCKQDLTKTDVAVALSVSDETAPAEGSSSSAPAAAANSGACAPVK